MTSYTLGRLVVPAVRTVAAPPPLQHPSGFKNKCRTAEDRDR